MKKLIFILASLILSSQVFSAELPREDRVQLIQLRMWIKAFGKEGYNVADWAKRWADDYNSSFNKGPAKYNYCELMKSKGNDFYAKYSQMVAASAQTVAKLNSFSNRAGELRNSLNNASMQMFQAIQKCKDVSASADTFIGGINNVKGAEALLAQIIPEVSGEKIIPETDYNRIVPGKTKLIFKKDFTVEILVDDVTGMRNSYFASIDNGRQCVFSFPASKRSVIAAGTAFEIILATEETGNEMGGTILWNPTYESTSLKGSINCEKGLSIEQIQRMLNGNGLELQGLEN